MQARQDGVPIVLGVTGHRDLLPEDEARLRTTLREQIVRIRSQCPHTELACLCSLAEGGDQLCARVALEMHMRLIVPLPLTSEEYEKDFSGEALEAFRSLISQAEDVFVVPDLEGMGDGSRDYAYRQAGIYVARHCHALLALWDGKPGISDCGTAAAVEFKPKQSYCVPDLPLPAPDEGVVLHIPTRRRKAPDEPYDGMPRLLENAPGSLERLLRETDRFNADAAKTKRGYPAFDEPSLGALGPRAQAVNRVYMRADSLAVRYRDRHIASIGLLCVLGALLVASFLLYDELEQKWFLPVYGLLALCACGLYGVARAGLSPKVLRISPLCRDLAGAAQPDGRRAGRGGRRPDALVAAHARAVDQGGRQHAARLRAARRGAGSGGRKNGMALDQLHYHQRTREKNLARAKRQEGISAGMLALTAVYFLFVLAAEFLFPATMDATPWPGLILRGLMKILLGLIPACTLVATSYYGKLCIRRNLRDGQRMISLYTQALAAYDDPKTDRAALLRELAREELVENGGWLTSTSENEAELPL